jgi:coenzyme F420 hydrogenase subunit beta
MHMTQHPNIKSIQQVLDSDLCVGCGACQHIVPSKIKIALNANGYLRPHILMPLEATENKHALAVCPGIHVEHTPPLQPKDEMWGPVISCQAGWSTNAALRHQASSGGGLSALAGYLLDSLLVDAVLHIGVSNSDPLTNEYRISTTKEQVAQNAGSRYAPAAPLLGLEDALSKHKKLAFIGKPCDVVAMRKLANMDTRVANQVLYCLSFMCAGVPSMKGTHAVLKHLDTPVDQLVQFKYRGNGWPGLATATRRDGTTKSMTYDESWGQILNRHLQFRCKICFDGTGEFADITCADAWYGNKGGYPSFEEAAGRSLLITRTAKGQALLERALADGVIEITSIPNTDLPIIQPYQASRKKLALSRMIAIRLSGKMPPNYNQTSMLRLAKAASLKENIKSFGGTLKRVLKTRKPR